MSWFWRRERSRNQSPEELNPNLYRSQSMAVRPQEDDGHPHVRVRRLSARQCLDDELNLNRNRNRNQSICPEELDPNLYRSRSISVWPQEDVRPQEDEEDDGHPHLNRIRSLSVRDRVDNELNLNRNRNRNRDRDRNPNRPTPQEMNELILMLDEMKDDDDDDVVKLTREDRDDAYVYIDRDDAYVYIEEALKGAKMNLTWKRKIFSQRPENDDEELRKEIDNRLKFYHPDIAQEYWVKERYSILERREYEKDVSTTEGFEVGYYPYLMRNSSSLIIRYYCPPDANLSHDSIAQLYGLAIHAIQFYNSIEQTNYSVVKVIKAMTDVAAGTWFYITFQASVPCYGDHLWTFEAKLFKSIPCPQPYIKVAFVRLKMGPSSLIQEPYAANLIHEAQACSSSTFFNPFAGQ